MSSKKYFSASLLGFLFEDDREAFQKRNGWPLDAVEISDRWHEYLISGQASGKRIIANSHGQPILEEPRPLTGKEIESAAEQNKAELMRVANDTITPLQDAVDLGIETDAETVRLLAWKTYRVMLNRVELSNPVWPEVPQ